VPLTTSHSLFDGPVTFHEHVALTRASREADGSRNIALVLAVQGGVDVQAMGSAIRWLSARHETFRTGFTATPGGFRRRVGEAAIDLSIVDLGGEAEARDHVARLAREVRPLDVAPLGTLTLLRAAPDRSYLVAVMDHVAMDYASALIAARELGRAYDAFVGRSAPDLPPAPQPRDQVAELGAILAPALVERARWATPWPEDGFRLAPDPSRPGGLAPSTGVRVFALPPRRSVYALATRQGVCQVAPFLAAFARSLRSHTGRADVGFSLARSGRCTPAQRHTIARDRQPSVHGHVLGDEPSRGAVRRTARRGRSLRSRRCPLAADVQRDDGASHPARPDEPPRIEVHVADVEPHRVRPPGSPAAPALWEALDLVVQIAEVGSVLAAMVAYRECCFEPSTIDRLGEGLAQALSAAVAS
jgi:hypothetical protein